MPRAPVPILSVLRPKTVQRFRLKLVQQGECLVFTGARNKPGYGFVDVSYDYGKRRYPILAHRLAWALSNGVDPPEDKIICHRCHNPACCNPDHLYAGTALDNCHDMIRAGRRVAGGWGVKGWTGPTHPAAKYTQAQRDEVIRLRREAKSYRVIEELTGIGLQTASRWWNEILPKKDKLPQAETVD